MEQITQHLIVFAIVTICVAFVVRGVIRTLSQRRRGIGQCCSKGCEPVAKPQTVGQTVFIPSDTLRKKKVKPSLASAK
jgi:hypothetical protein